jgi:hypothetical protein
MPDEAEIPRVKNKKLNILDEYWEGMEANDHGFDATNNPYDPGSRKFHAWYLGWFESSQDEAYRG